MSEQTLREALAELVILKDMTDTADAHCFPPDHPVRLEYRRRKPIAWAAARAALAEPVAQPVAWIQEQQGFFPGDGRRDLVWQRNTNADPAYWKYIPLYTEPKGKP